MLAKNGRWRSGSFNKLEIGVLRPSLPFLGGEEVLAGFAPSTSKQEDELTSLTNLQYELCAIPFCRYLRWSSDNLFDML